MEMKTLERTAVLTALEDAGLTENALYTDYSGRGMYGAECLGLVGGPANFARFYIRLAGQIGMDEAEELAEAACEDDMGLERIVYWPGWELEEEIEEAYGLPLYKVGAALDEGRA